MAPITETLTCIPWNYVLFVHVNNNNGITIDLSFFLPSHSNNGPHLLPLMTLMISPFTTTDDNTDMAPIITNATQTLSFPNHLPFPSLPHNYGLPRQITMHVSLTMTMMMNKITIPFPVMNTTMAINTPMATATTQTPLIPLNHQVYMVLAS